jgi:hypothetical protein
MMTRFARLAVLGSALCAATLSSTAAFAQPGYMTCQAAESSRQKVFSSPREFRANSADADKAFDYFTKAYQAGKAPLLGADLSHYQGICHWEAKPNVAMGMTTNYMIHFLKLGYFTFTEVVMPDPFVP